MQVLTLVRKHCKPLNWILSFQSTFLFEIWTLSFFKSLKIQKNIYLGYPVSSWATTTVLIHPKKDNDGMDAVYFPPCCQSAFKFSWLFLKHYIWSLCSIYSSWEVYLQVVLSLGKPNVLNDVTFHTNINSLFQITFDVLLGAPGSLCMLRCTSIYEIKVLLKILLKIFKLNLTVPVTEL